MMFLSMLALQGVQKCITVNCRGREREREPKYVMFPSMLALQGVQKSITVNCRGREREGRDRAGSELLMFLDLLALQGRSNILLKGR